MENFEDRFALAFNALNANAIAKYKAFGGHSDIHLEYEEGKRYIRLIQAGPAQRSAYGFVDKTNGDILKAAGWKAPAKNFARGNIFNDLESLKKFDWTGIS